VNRISEKSFFDWEKDLEGGSQIKKENKKNQDKNKKIKLNKIGLPEEIFKNYLKKWKKENLKDVKIND